MEFPFVELVNSLAAVELNEDTVIPHIRRITGFPYELCIPVYTELWCLDWFHSEGSHIWCEGIDYPPEVFTRVGKIIDMYKSVAAGEDVGWVCLCPPPCSVCGRYTSRPSLSSHDCIRCPALNISVSGPLDPVRCLCAGPGGHSWRIIRRHVMAGTDCDVKSLAAEKAEAWCKWLERR